MAQTARGFTLIEALIALAILAVAASGLIRAIEAHVDMIRGLQARAVAGWIADNHLVELGLPGAPALPADEEMLGQRWHVETSTVPTSDPDLAAVTVSVAPAGKAPIVQLHGFVDRGATP